ncbi:MAG: phosphoribosylformylglycinamidine cyclo-ligase [Lentisphaerae bacterium]|nr:phosphoribosylformylglycinamidine cyclo-ligase [Lentisphaerota bacterium]
MQKRKQSAYAAAGVNIDDKMSGLKSIKKMVKSTAREGVISNIGAFGGMFRSPGSDHILVASADGVGTKLKVAVMAKKHDTIGQDLVNHCVNDILVQGASPLFFLDYYGTSIIEGETFKNVVSGLSKACKENNCALLGGETAEMPGLYPKGEYDLVGTIVGSVHKDEVITGDSIQPGDRLIGLPSSGLHTNGYSLARKIVFETAKLKVNDLFPGTKRKVSDVLLAVHKSYLNPILALRKTVTVQGLVHITGGGFPDNIPRVLPDGLKAVVDVTSWQPSVLFEFLMTKGKVEKEEMYRVFNMGIGLVIFVRENEVAEAMSVLKNANARPKLIGYVEKSNKQEVELKGL